ncbi:MAG TPA: MBL fold metallo-hydrolase [Candidatus Obscuribacterales bacterium]
MSDLIHSAVVIVVRHAPDLQVLAVRRAENQRSFPGHWIFPGGLRDAADSQLPSGVTETADAADRQCVLRELFEETGVLIGFSGDRSGLAQAQQDLLAGSLSWADFCTQFAYTPPLEALTDLGLRVTPPILPRRFETAYYLLVDEAAPEPIVLSPELCEGGWMAPAALLARWRAGHTVIAVPVLEVLKVLAESVPGQGPDLDRLRAQANDRDTLPIPIEPHPGIELTPLRTPTLAPATHTNGYLVGDQSFVIVDPASPYADEQAVLKRILQRRLDLGHRPLAVLLTHHHRDHVGAAVFVRDWLGVPIAAHAETAALVDFSVDQIVNDGDQWDLGQDATGLPWKLEAMFTPGHAPGHLCFIDSRHRVALVGDMLAGIGTILIKRPKGNMGQYLASLQRMADAGLSRGFPSHGPVIPDLKARCLEYIEHRHMRESRILAALEPGPLSEAELIESVYAGTDPRALPLARWSLEAHLYRLAEVGQVESLEPEQGKATVWGLKAGV